MICSSSYVSIFFVTLRMTFLGLGSIRVSKFCWFTLRCNCNCVAELLKFYFTQLSTNKSKKIMNELHALEPSWNHRIFYFNFVGAIYIVYKYELQITNWKSITKYFEHNTCIPSTRNIFPELHLAGIWL